MLLRSLSSAAAALPRRSARALSAASNSIPFGAPVLPFHHAFPVNNLDTSRAFYRDLLGCEEGRSSKTWIDCAWRGAGVRQRLAGASH